MSQDVKTIVVICFITIWLPHCSPVEPQTATSDPAQTTSVSSNNTPQYDEDLIKDYPFASMCLFLGADASGGCQESPDIASTENFQKFIETPEEAACLNAGQFFDVSTIEPECRTNMESNNLNPNYDNVKEQLAHISGLADILEGYKRLGWRVKQLSWQLGHPYCALETVIQFGNKLHMYRKIGHLEQWKNVCSASEQGCTVTGGIPPASEDSEIFFISDPVFMGEIPL